MEQLAGILPLLLIFVVFYFLLIRPQQKKLKDHKNMIANLKKGDRIVTQGGIIGNIQASEVLKKRNDNRQNIHNPSKHPIPTTVNHRQQQQQDQYRFLLNNYIYFLMLYFFVPFF